MHLIQRFVDGLDSVNLEDFLTSYRICTLFRMLKITGLYNRASKRDGRTDLPWDMDLVWHGICLGHIWRTLTVNCHLMI